MPAIGNFAFVLALLSPDQEDAYDGLVMSLYSAYVLLMHGEGLGETNLYVSSGSIQLEEFERWAADKGSQMNLELLDGLHIPGKSLIAV